MEGLDEFQTHEFRFLAARANYLSLDRPNTLYPTRELCQRMAAPTAIAQEAREGVVRYLRSFPRFVYHYDWHSSADLDAHADTNFASCLATRRSTSGGIAMRGAHLLKHCSGTRKAVAQSSAEAELYGIVNGTTKSLGN